MTLDDLQNEHRNMVEKLNTFVFKRESFSYETNKGAAVHIDTVSRVYENNGEHIATLSGYDAAPLRGATSATVWYNGCNYPATIQKRRDGDVDLSFTPACGECIP